MLEELHHLMHHSLYDSDIKHLLTLSASVGAVIKL